ncbi:MAG: hypothetical protein ACUZ8N_05590 [Candidatus Scalindua sp.]
MITKLNSSPYREISLLSGDPFCLGNHLLDGGFIDEEKLSAALVKHKSGNLLLGECLVKDESISGETLDTVLAFQGKIREIVHDASSASNTKRLKLGQLLVATKMISVGSLKKAVKLQKRCNKLLGETLVEIGAISRNVLALALGAQKKILILSAFAVLSSPLTGVCDTLTPGSSPASSYVSSYDHVGIPIQTTPYDKRYKKIEKYLETSYKKVKKYLKIASRFKYKDDSRGADNWQLPFETEKLGTGDCDDKAIWLYSKLIKEGIDDVRLVLGNYKRGELSVHMWVNWYHDGQVFILDPTIDNGIRPAEQYSKDYYQPFYSFHKGKKWKHNA